MRAKDTANGRRNKLEYSGGRYYVADFRSRTFQTRSKSALAEAIPPESGVSL